MEIKEIKVGELKPWDKNPRRHDIDKIVKSIETFGFRSPLVVNHKNGEYVVEAGHGRLEAAIKVGLERLPCLVVEDDEKTAAAYAIADNRLQELGGWDPETLADLLKGMEDDLLLISGFNQDELNKLLSEIEIEDKTNREETFDVEKAMAAAPETVTNIKKGDIYQLGPHRLMCGDSTAREDIEKLMSGELANLVFTDPPYNVNYRSKAGNSYSDGKYGKLKQFEDDKTLSGYHYFITAVIENLYKFTGEKVPVYMWYGSLYSDLVVGAFRQKGYSIQTPIIWLKEHFVFSYSTYHKCYEVLAYCWKNHHRPFENRKATAKETDVWLDVDKMTFMDYLDIWYVPRDNTNNYVHPTQKPTALAERALRNSSCPDDIVLDLFGGSGSTLIACEKMQRRSFTMEVDPHYCGVIIERWKSFSGKEPVQVEV